ncbi:MAG: restriction endonuclease subunit S [Muribaculaceae bacterium]|nr:restriction endonuclease subunit S [Muribaculaceae bacterium]
MANNNNPQEYKMTEWETYRLGDIAKFQTGKLNSNAAVENGKYPFFTCSPTTLSIDTYAFDKEAILLAGNNAEGNFSIKYYKGKFNAYQRTYIIETYNDICDIKFLFYALKLCLQQFKLMSQGTSTKFLTAVILNNFEISLPGLEEQRRIAGILGAIDDKIENNRRINTNLELQAQALFDKWCESCSKNITIKELADNILDYTPNANSEVVLLNSSDVTQGVFAKLPLVSNVNLKGQFKKRFQKGDILYSEIRPSNKHYAYCYFDSDRYIASTRLIVLRGKKEKIVSNTLLYQYLISQNVFEEFTLKTETRSGTFPQGNYQDLSSIVVPYSDNQREIAGVLDSIYKRIWHNNTEIENLATLRDTLLPKLMNGEIKISEL